MQPATADNPFAGRAGLVGTQNIRNNQSRVGGLDHVVQSGVIVEAVENQPWSGEANVHVAIANWVKTGDGKEREEALLIPAKRRLWSKVELSDPLFESTEVAARPRVETLGKRGGIRRDKSFELRSRNCTDISSSLSDEIDTSHARVLQVTGIHGGCYTGQYPRHGGFMLSKQEADALFSKSEKNRKVVHPFLVGRELLGDFSGCDRFVIDFQTKSIIESKAFTGPFAVIEKKVLPHVKAKAEAERRLTGKKSGQEQNWLNVWWQHFRPRPELISKISKHSRYIVCSRVTKRPVFVFLSSKIRPGDALSCFTFDDDYSFGVLQSNAHWQWFVAKCSKLTERFRYTPESVFDTFPWPQSARAADIKAVARTARKIREVREVALRSIKGGLRGLYRTLELPGKNPLKSAHADLDDAVLSAYGFSPKKALLKQLLNLNLAVARGIERGEAVVGPGLPPGIRDREYFVTSDCINP